MAAHEAPPSLGFSRQEHWSGLPDDRIVVGFEVSDTDRNGEDWLDSGYILKADQCNY